MINTKTLRQQYQLERATMTRNENIGAIVLTVLTVFWSVMILAAVVRFSCLAIVALHNFIK
jgi:hypothetical protein